MVDLLPIKRQALINLVKRIRKAGCSEGDDDLGLVLQAFAILLLNISQEDYPEWNCDNISSVAGSSTSRNLKSSASLLFMRPATGRQETQCFVPQHAAEDLLLLSNLTRLTAQEKLRLATQQLVVHSQLPVNTRASVETTGGSSGAESLSEFQKAEESIRRWLLTCLCCLDIMALAWLPYAFYGSDEKVPNCDAIGSRSFRALRRVALTRCLEEAMLYTAPTAGLWMRLSFSQYLQGNIMMCMGNLNQATSLCEGKGSKLQAALIRKQERPSGEESLEEVLRKDFIDELSPSLAFVFLWKAKLCINEVRDSQQAISICQEWLPAGRVTVNGNDLEDSVIFKPQFYRLMGIAFLLESQQAALYSDRHRLLDQAETNLRNANRMEPACWKTLFSLALCLARLGRVEESREFVWKSIRQFEGYVGSWVLACLLSTIPVQTQSCCGCDPEAVITEALMEHRGSVPLLLVQAQWIAATSPEYTEVLPFEALEVEEEDVPSSLDVLRGHVHSSDDCRACDDADQKSELVQAPVVSQAPPPSPRANQAISLFQALLSTIRERKSWVSTAACVTPRQSLLGGESLSVVTGGEGSCGKLRGAPVIGFSGGGFPLPSSNTKQNVGLNESPYLDELIREDVVLLTYAEIACRLHRFEVAQRCLTDASVLIANLQSKQQVSLDCWSAHQYASAYLACWCGRVRDADRMVRDILLRSPFHYKAMLLRGRILFHLGNTDEAYSTLRRAAAVDDQDAVSAYFLAQCQQKMHLHEEAAKNFVNALRLRASQPLISYDIIPVYVL